MITDFLLRSKRIRTAENMQNIGAAMMGAGYAPNVLAAMMSNITHENDTLRDVLDHESGATLSDDPIILDIVQKRAYLAENPGVNLGQPIGGFAGGQGGEPPIIVGAPVASQ